MEWLHIAGLCKRLSVLPNDGGLLQQDPRHIRRLMIIYGHMDDQEELEMTKASKG